MKKTQEPDSGSLGKTITDCIQEKKGKHIVLIDLQVTDNSVCDYFVIAHGDASTQVKAISEHIEDTLKKQYGLKAYHAEGYENSHWVLLDYGSIVVHIFLESVREYYKLEELWADAELEVISEKEEDFTF